MFCLSLLLVFLFSHFLAPLSCCLFSFSFGVVLVGASHKQPLERKRRTAGREDDDSIGDWDGRYDSEPDDDTMLTAECRELRRLGY